MGPGLEVHPGGGNSVFSEGDRKRLQGQCSCVGVFAKSDRGPYESSQDRCGPTQNSTVKEMLLWVVLQAM